MSFDPNEKQSVNLREKAMKSARKAKDKLHKACKEPQKFVSELCIPGTQEQNRMHMASMRESRGSDRF